MKYLLISLITISSLQAHSLETVSQLNINRYMGLWHEIASIPQFFSKSCIKNTTAFYELMEDDTVRVENSCIESDGLEVAEGVARINPRFNSESKLQVTFANFVPAWLKNKKPSLFKNNTIKFLKSLGWSVAGDYWVLQLDRHYQWAIVGHPNKKFLWILSRKTKMSRPRLRTLRNYIDSIGYDTCEILMNAKDDNKYSGEERLCDLKL